jgi:hypothetical protein
MAMLDFNNILGEQEIDGLFSDTEEPATQEESAESDKEKSDGTVNGDTQKTTEVVNPDDLFSGDTIEEEEEKTQPESVGSGKNKEEKEDATAGKGSDTSPNFYSSIANALAVDGIFPNSDEAAVSKVDSAESLSELIEAEINARFDDKQRRISKALENGVEPSQIRQYEGVLEQISNITDNQLTAESEEGERLRRNLIYQDYLNKGYTPEKAQKMTQRTFDSGTDIEDAKDALQGNREFFQAQYDKLLEEAQKAAEKDKAELQKQEANLKKSILEDKQLMGDMELNQDVRKKIYDNISRPVYRDPESGQYLTALQKYESENHADFMKYVGLFYTLTDGFKDFKSFAKAEVKKEMRKGLRELEQTLNGSRRTSDGSLNLVGSRKEDPESFLSAGFKLAL